MLARLAGHAQRGGADPWAAVAATRPAHETAVRKNADVALEDLVRRIQEIKPGVAKGPTPDSSPSLAKAVEPAGGGTAAHFVPREPASFLDAAYRERGRGPGAQAVSVARGEASGRFASEHVRLPFLLLDGLLRQMKQDQLVVHKGAAPMNDYVYQATELGRERRATAGRALHLTSSAAPVSLKDYIWAVKAQSLTAQHPTAEDLKRAFGDLLINTRTLNRLGPAINSGRGLFLFGAAGNGKTSIAERVTKVFGEFIWIPRAIGIDGEIIRLFDPSNHEEAAPENGSGLLDDSKVGQTLGAYSPAHDRRRRRVSTMESTWKSRSILRRASAKVAHATQEQTAARW